MLEPWTVEHFTAYASALVYDDGEKREPEDWQLAFVADLFEGRRENWLITPEGNGKTTFTAILALYGADFTDSPWIPVGAASSKQARILHDQAGEFVRKTEGLETRFRVFDGYLKIASKENGGRGIEIFAADPKTGDGVIPYPFAIIDEGHRQEDMRLYRLWKGKLRKRGGQIIMLSTAGEPETPFENTREHIRRRGGDRKRDGAFQRVASDSLVMHEFMVVSDEACTDLTAVKEANPLSSITVEALREDFDSDTFDLGDWKRLKCNRPTRSAQTAITDSEWDKAEAGIPWVEGETIDLGLDVAWKWDTTAFAQLWKGPNYRLLGPAEIIKPPRDGSTLHPDEIKNAFEEIADRNAVASVVMDTSKAEDTAAWLEEQGVTVIDRGNTNQPAVQDYEAFMEGLRNDTLKHTGHPGLRAHVLNAIARRLPGGDRRFDRASVVRQNVKAQDRRVIDALTAAGMVVYLSTLDTEPAESVYSKRELVTA
jgi:phage terminase large subunit-like protein